MEPGYVPQYLYPTVVARATALPPESQMNYKMLLKFLIGKPLIKKLTLNKYLLAPVLQHSNANLMCKCLAA